MQYKYVTQVNERLLNKFMEEFIKDKLTEYVKQELNIKHCKFELEKINGGWVSDIWVLRSEDEDNLIKNEFIIKIYPSTYSKQKSVKEFNVMKRLSSIGFKVPNVLLVELNNAVIGRPFIIMEKVNGKNMVEAISQSSYLGKIVMMKKCCKLLASIHNIDFMSVMEPDNDLSEEFNINTVLIKKIDEARKQLGELKVESFFSILDWLIERINEVEYQKIGFVHGDFNQSNIIVDEKGICTVIDWTTAAIDDIRFDLADFITTNDIEIRESLISMYEKFSGVKIQFIEYFEVFEAAKKLFISYAIIQLGTESVGLSRNAEASIVDMEYMKNSYSTITKHTSLRIPEIENIFKESEL